MQIQQKLSLKDYHLYLKESIFENALFKLMRVTGLVLFALVLYKFINEDFSYSASMNALIGISLLVYNMRHLSFFAERRRLNKSSYVDQLLEEHDIIFEGDCVSIRKGEDEFKFEKTDIEAVKDFPSFIVLEISAISNFPIPKHAHSKETQKFILEWVS